MARGGIAPASHLDAWQPGRGFRQRRIARRMDAESYRGAYRAPRERFLSQQDRQDSGGLQTHRRTNQRLIPRMDSLTS